MLSTKVKDNPPPKDNKFLLYYTSRELFESKTEEELSKYNQRLFLDMLDYAVVEYLESRHSTADYRYEHSIIYHTLILKLLDMGIVKYIIAELDDLEKVYYEYNHNMLSSKEYRVYLFLKELLKRSNRDIVFRA